jgi:hypothetical protein
MPELTTHQKGHIGERLITDYSSVSPKAHPLLHSVIVNHVIENHRDAVTRCRRFSLNIVHKKDKNAFADDGEEKTAKWRYQKGEAPKTEDGRPKSYDGVPAWRPDAAVVVTFSKSRALMTFKTVEYPLEIKTGKSATIRGEQREAFIHASKEIDGQPLLIRVDISDLPERYSISVKRYVEGRDQIRKYNADNLPDNSDILEEKLLR